MPINTKPTMTEWCIYCSILFYRETPGLPNLFSAEAVGLPLSRWVGGSVSSRFFSLVQLVFDVPQLVGNILIELLYSGLELGADAVCDWRRAIPALAEIFAVSDVGHRSTSSLTMALYEISSSAIVKQALWWQENL